MSTYVFVGPTIPVREAKYSLDATYLPPVSQGDIASLLRQRPRIIGIIDGYFESVPAVWHKEILLALSSGVQVVGSASFGALRAVELARYGMIGIGEIFQWYRDGVIDADDEVAIRHASQESEYRGVSEAMVNMRSTFQAARDQSIISPATADTLIAICKRTHYAQRSYAAALDQGAAAGLPERELSALRAFLKEHRVDQKKLDAIAMLEHIAGMEKSERVPVATFELQYTTRLDELMDRDVRVDPAGEINLTPDTLVAHCAADHEAFEQLNERAATTRLVLDLAERLGVGVSDAEIQAGTKDFHESLGLTTDDAAAQWARQNHLTAPERDRLIAEWLLVGKVRAAFRPGNRDLIRQLKWEGSYEKAVEEFRP